MRFSNDFSRFAWNNRAHKKIYWFLDGEKKAEYVNEKKI